MSTDDTKAENQRNYQKLIVALEASQGILNLLIAVCDDRNLREKLIQQYETELRQQDFFTYRIRVRNQDPSLRYAVAQLIEAEPDLQQGNPAVITVLGIDELLSVKLDAPKSEEDRFFGYLQWTREALRQFYFPIVLWLTEPILVRLVEKAPDFWSWRGGVFWFKRESVSQELASADVSRHISKTIPEEPGGLPLEEILRLIEQIEAQEKEAPLLATLYDSLAKAYEQRYRSQQERQLAIKAYEKAIALQTKLGLKADLASSLEKLGNLYFEFQDEVKKAHDCYQQALLIYQEIGDRQGEANTLKAIGDVLRFLKRSDEALERYQTALSFYRDTGSRLGEANILQEFGKLQENPQQALEYLQQAQNLYIQIGDIYSQSRNLAYFIANAQLNMGDSETAINSLTHAAELATTINYAPIQEYAQSRIAEINSTPTPTGE
jgi:tetratricopeptide (TPR) repeat protein